MIVGSKGGFAIYAHQVDNMEMTPSNRVYAFILDKIKSNEWPLDSKIMTESQLCHTLAVSRVAVREAIERLAALGLLVKKQGSGTFVAKVKLGDFINHMMSMVLVEKRDVVSVLQFRRYFEAGTVEMFTENREPAELARLEENYREYAELAARDPNDFKRLAELDYEFHRIISIGSKNQFAIKTSEVLMGIMREHLTLFSITGRLENALIYHREIINAIKLGEKEVAAKYMQKHIDIATDTFLK